MKYMVTFKYSSFYEDESENKVAEDTLEYEARDLDELWTILGDEVYNDDIVINYEAKSHVLIQNATKSKL